MATIEQLRQQGTLRLAQIRLGRREFPSRLMYASPQFWAWLMGPVKAAKPFHGDSVSPALQAFALLKGFITGQAFEHPKLFKRMSPITDDIWELRTDDLRFFGWFHRKDCFVATSGDFFVNLKADGSLYEKHRIASVEFRTQIDLDEPKYAKGAKHDDVVS